MISSNDLKPGQTINVDGDIYVVLDISQNKTARSAMVVKAKVRNQIGRASCRERVFTGV